MGRVTQDLDIVLPADRVEEFLCAAAVSGFEVLPATPGRWPKVHHQESDIQVDILPEGGCPGTAAKPAPTTIPHPKDLGAAGIALRYIPLAALMELKIAAGRARDEGDVIELLRARTGTRSGASAGIWSRSTPTTWPLSTAWFNSPKNKRIGNRPCMLGAVLSTDAPIMRLIWSASDVPP
jgi:hypothetical protein